ncbi:Uncharacterised protein [Mycobacteroides abscessus]|nr:Uncharacterised protein [Mycobacteroides abscessus]
MLHDSQRDGCRYARQPVTRSHFSSPRAFPRSSTQSPSPRSRTSRAVRSRPPRKSGPASTRRGRGAGSSAQRRRRLSIPLWSGSYRPIQKK